MKQIFSFLTAMLAVTICHSQANTKLSNLVSPTAVNVSLLSGSTNGTKNLGADTKQWKNAYFYGTIFASGTENSWAISGDNSTGSYGVFGRSKSVGVYGTGPDWGVYGKYKQRISKTKRA